MSGKSRDGSGYRLLRALRGRRVCGGLVSIALATLLLGTGFWLSLPPYDGSESVLGLHAPVEIVRDAVAVPHIWSAPKFATPYMIATLGYRRDNLDEVRSS